MIYIIDYGLGNIKAFENVYKKLNIPVGIARNADEVLSATKLILPGVGSFDYAMTMLNESGLRHAIEYKVLVEKIPIIGICVGMQMMADNSEEGVLPGLGWIKGQVKLFDEKPIRFNTKLPHMGWNNIEIMHEDCLLDGLDNSSRFYFLHSYYFTCEESDKILAISDYGERFTCVINQNNIYGIQFHPEKSHSNGIRLLKNFSKL